MVHTESSPPDSVDARFPWSWVIAVLLVHAWLWPYWPWLLAPDDNSRLYLVRAIVEDGRFGVDGQVLRFGELQVLARYDGHWYSDKAIGHPAIAALAYLPIHAMVGDKASQPLLWHILSWLTLALPTALVAAALCQDLKPALGRGADLAAASYALGSPALPYASLFYGHQMAAACFYLAWRLIARDRMGWAGICLGLAVVTEFPTAALAGALGAWALVRASDNQARLRLVLGGLLPGLVQAAYNYSIFGNPLELTYAHKTDAAGSAIHAVGYLGITFLPRAEAIFGLLFGTSKGLVYYAPPVLLAMLGAFLSKGRRIIGREAILAGFAALLVLLASFSSWQGGWTTGPRMLLPALPLVYLLLGQWGSRLPATSLALLCGVGLVHTGLPTLTFPLLPPEVADPVPEIAANLAREGAWTFTLGAFWMPLWMGATLLVTFIGAALVWHCGLKLSSIVAAGAAAALASTELRRPEPAGDPRVALVMMTDLYFVGLPERAAALGEKVLQTLSLPPPLRATFHEEVLRNRRGVPPPRLPDLWADPHLAAKDRP